MLETAVITMPEATVLMDMVMEDLEIVNQELELLERCPVEVRDGLYGRNILQATYGVRDDMVELLALAAFAAHL